MNKLALLLLLISLPVFATKYFTDFAVEDGKVQMKERSVAPTDIPDYGFIYPKTDNRLYYMDDAGLETDILVGTTVLDDIADVDASSPSAGDILTFDGFNWVDSTGIYVSPTQFAIGTSSPSANALFDLVSTTKGSRPCPVMTEVQRDAIVAPATGLCVFNSTTTNLNTYSGSNWVAVGSGGLSIWETAFGYVIDDIVTTDNKIYKALTNHTSGVFATDFAGGAWEELYSQTITLSSLTASRPVLSSASKVLVSGQIDLANTNHVTGTLPLGNGGTGLTSVGTANQLFGTNAGATAFEHKGVTATAAGALGATTGTFSGNISLSATVRNLLTPNSNGILHIHNGSTSCTGIGTTSNCATEGAGIDFGGSGSGSGDLALRAATGTGSMGFFNGVTERARLASTGVFSFLTSAVDFADDIQMSGATSGVGTDTADGADNKSLNLMAGNSVISPTTRGAFLQLHGNEVATVGGDITMKPGSGVSASIEMYDGSNTLAGGMNTTGEFWQADFDADEVVVTNAGSGLSTASTISLTELNQLEGASSPIQTQLANKLDSSFSSNILQGALTDETGSGFLAFGSGGSFSSPQISVQSDYLATAGARFQDTTGGQYAEIKAPGAITTSWTMTLPTGSGTAGYLLSTDGTGVTSWVVPGEPLNESYVLEFSTSTCDPAFGNTDNATYQKVTDSGCTTTEKIGASRGTPLSTSTSLGFSTNLTAGDYEVCATFNHSLENTTAGTQLYQYFQVQGCTGTSSCGAWTIGGMIGVNYHYTVNDEDLLTRSTLHICTYLNVASTDDYTFEFTERTDTISGTTGNNGLDIGDNLMALQMSLKKIY